MGGNAFYFVDLNSKFEYNFFKYIIYQEFEHIKYLIQKCLAVKRENKNFDRGKTNGGITVYLEINDGFTKKKLNFKYLGRDMVYNLTLFI